MAYEIAVMLGSIGASAMFFYLSAQMREDRIWKVIQSLFFFMGIFALLQASALSLNIATAASAPEGVITILNNQVQVVTWALYVSMAFFVIAIIYTALSWAVAARK